MIALSIQNLGTCLQHGGDTGTTSEHADGTGHIGCVYESALGSADVDLVANLELTDVLGYITHGVGLRIYAPISI